MVSMSIAMAIPALFLVPPDNSAAYENLMFQVVIPDKDVIKAHG
ncbi:MAG: hypothetical protein ACE14T_10380 [Syntrophales bacterium]